jgi:hypothetical protein
MDRPTRDDYRKLDNLPSIALREAWLWGNAVHRLAQSIETSSDNMSSQIDAMLLAVAYRNVYRGAEMAARYLPKERRKRLRAAMRAADELTPGAKKVRDMLEHFDEYEAGKGWMQSRADVNGGRRPNEQLAQGHLIHFRRGETFALVVGDQELETGSVRQATRLLIDAIHQQANRAEGGIS